MKDVTELRICPVEAVIALVGQGGPVNVQVPVRRGQVHVDVILQNDQVLVNIEPKLILLRSAVIYPKFRFYISASSVKLLGNAGNSVSL